MLPHFVARVQDLESSITAKENAIRELENNLNDQRQIINRQHNELEQMNDKLAIEARRIKSLEREGDRLRSEISLLESKVRVRKFIFYFVVKCLLFP